MSKGNLTTNVQSSLQRGNSGTGDLLLPIQPSMVRQSEMASLVLGNLASGSLDKGATYTGRGGRAPLPVHRDVRLFIPRLQSRQLDVVPDSKRVRARCKSI